MFETRERERAPISLTDAEAQGIDRKKEMTERKQRKRKWA
jgi:hypothetical protein